MSYDGGYMTRFFASGYAVFRSIPEENTMTSIPHFSQTSAHIVDTQHILANFPVGGADPDFVVTKSAKPKFCAVPVVGKLLPQCK